MVRVEIDGFKIGGRRFRILFISKVFQRRPDSSGIRVTNRVLSMRNILSIFEQLSVVYYERHTLMKYSN